MMTYKNNCSSSRRFVLRVAIQLTRTAIGSCSYLYCCCFFFRLYLRLGKSRPPAVYWLRGRRGFFCRFKISTNRKKKTIKSAASLGSSSSECINASNANDSDVLWTHTLYASYHFKNRQKL